MKTVNGRPRFDSIFLGQITVELLSVPDLHLQATFGYAGSKDQRRYGQSSRSAGWSPETLKRLNALVESIEQDIASDIFEGVTSPGGETEGDPPIDSVPGL
jgi:hypothetical protein